MRRKKDVYVQIPFIHAATAFIFPRGRAILGDGWCAIYRISRGTRMQAGNNIEEPQPVPYRGGESATMARGGGA